MMTSTRGTALTDACHIHYIVQCAPLTNVDADADHVKDHPNLPAIHPIQDTTTLTGLNPGTLTQRVPHLRDLSHHHPHQRRNGLQYQNGMTVIHFATNLEVDPDLS